MISDTILCRDATAVNNDSPGVCMYSPENFQVSISTERIEEFGHTADFYEHLDTYFGQISLIGSGIDIIYPVPNNIIQFFYKNTRLIE